MIYLPPIPSLSLLTVLYPGIPNQECIVLQTNSEVNLAQFAIVLVYKPAETSFPLKDHFFWLGDMQLDKGTYIYIYTGSGQTRHTKTSETNEPAYVIHWGKKNVVFDEPNIEPVLFQIGGMENMNMAIRNNRQSLPQD